MKYVLLFGLIITTCACSAQNNVATEASDEEYELIKLFLNRNKPYIFLDNRFSVRENVGLLKGKYSQQMRLYRTADSICTNKKDTILLKSFCPIAFNLSRYNGLLTEDDFVFLNKTYSKKSSGESILDIDRIAEECMIQKHSDQYYNYSEGDRAKLYNLDEFPSIQINQIYFTQNRQVAVIEFTIKDSPNDGSTGFFLFRKMKNIWWNPIGNLKF